MSLGDQVCEINTLTGEIFFNGHTIVLRPKTFQLFLMLASTPDVVFSKAEILASVWKGTVVEDQVIFQSINEIRKEFGQSEVIKTYPRRGYCIGVPISIIASTNKAMSKKTIQSHTKSPKKWVIPILLVLTGLGLIYFVSTTRTSFDETTSLKNEQSPAHRAVVHNGILVLPFNVRALTESQQWLRYGAMEGIINKIKPNKIGRAHV